MKRTRILLTLAALLLAALVGGCGGQSGATSPGATSGSTAASSPAQAPAAATSPAPSESATTDANGLHIGQYKVVGTEHVVVTTNKGSFEIAFFAADAPNTVSSFLELVDAKFYNGIRVHRVEPGFVMQVGDPQTKGLSAKAVRDIVARANANAPAPNDPPLGSGGPGWTMQSEFNSHKHDRGAVAMARAADPNSAGSQFYVVLQPAYSLDGQYTVFGHVVKGMSVVDKLQVGDIITSARIVAGK
jgi:peptidyl-prolyl cis-trans isomerase B (cyclophilin B)